MPRNKINFRRAVLVTIAAIILLVPFASACRKASSSDESKTISVEGGQFIDVMPDLLNRMLANKNFLLINVHTPYEGELPQTDLSIPYDQIDQNLSRLPDKRARIVLYCVSGHMSALAAQTLVKLGYKDVWSLHGGMQYWKESGYPLVQKGGPG